MQTIEIEPMPGVWPSTTLPLTYPRDWSPYLINDYFKRYDIIRAIGIEPMSRIWKNLSLPLTYARLFPSIQYRIILIGIFILI